MVVPRHGRTAPLYFPYLRGAGRPRAGRPQRTGSGSGSVTVEKKPDAYGRSLRFLLNGEPVFCKGANYIPCDCFLPRVTRETYERTIRDAVDVNMNMLRVWGGGIYEDDFFYELCDREGILIWQDFMYACAVYPAEGALLENMRLEAVDNVKRLRNHACVVYWCGNNENQDSWLSGWKYDVDKVDPEILRHHLETVRGAVLPHAGPSGGRIRPRHGLPAHLALLGLRRDEQRPRGRPALLGGMARQKTHHRVQPPAQPFLQRIRVPVVPVFRNGEALRAAARRPRHHVGSHDVPPAGRRARQQPDQKLPAERIPRTARFRVVPLRLPDLAGRRHQNGDRGAPPRQGLLLGIALLAAQRLLAGSFVVEPRLVRRLEGAALLRPLRIRRHTDLPDPRRRTTRHLRRFRPAHSGERHLVRPGGASDGRPDPGNSNSRSTSRPTPARKSPPSTRGRC